MEPYRWHILCCTNDKKETHCGQKGGHSIFDAFKSELTRRNLWSQVRLTRMGCNSQHHVGPVILIYPGGIWYKEVKPEDVPEILESHILGEKPVERLLHFQNPL